MSIRWRGTLGFEPRGRRFDSDMENCWYHTTSEIIGLINILVQYPLKKYTVKIRTPQIKIEI